MATSRVSTGKGLTLGIVGCGKMGGTVLAGVLKSVNKAKVAGTLGDIPVSSFIVSVYSSESADQLRSTFSSYAESLTVTQDNLEVFQRADVLILGFKPQNQEVILRSKGVRDAVKKKLVISLLAGSPPHKIEGYLYEDSKDVNCTIIRVCPSMSAEIGESMTIVEISNPPIPEKFSSINDWIFRQCGTIRPVNPDLFEASCSLTGCAIAFMTVTFDGMMDGAVFEGIKRKEAQALLSQTMMGLSKLMQQGQHPAKLRENAASPRGTTIGGLLKLEKAAVRAAFSDAVIESTLRARTM